MPWKLSAEVRIGREFDAPPQQGKSDMIPEVTGLGLEEVAAELSPSATEQADLHTREGH